MTNQPITLEFREYKERPALHFFIPSHERLADFISMLRSLSEAPKTIRLSDCGFVQLNNIQDVELVCIGDRKEPSRRLQPGKKRNHFRWVHDTEGWIACTGLAEGLKVPGHQYFDYGENNAVGVEASFLDDRA